MVQIYLKPIYWSQPNQNYWGIDKIIEGKNNHDYFVRHNSKFIVIYNFDLYIILFIGISILSGISVFATRQCCRLHGGVLVHNILPLAAWALGQYKCRSNSLVDYLHDQHRLWRTRSHDHLHGQDDFIFVKILSVNKTLAGSPMSACRRHLALFFKNTFG